MQLVFALDDLMQCGTNSEDLEDIEVEQILSNPPPAPVETITMEYIDSTQPRMNSVLGPWHWTFSGNNYRRSLREPNLYANLRPYTGWYYELLGEGGYAYCWYNSGFADGVYSECSADGALRYAISYSHGCETGWEESWHENGAPKKRFLHYYCVLIAGAEWDEHGNILSHRTPDELTDHQLSMMRARSEYFRDHPRNYGIDLPI